jgi:Protein of unknown function (DUF3592)
LVGQVFSEIQVVSVTPNPQSWLVRFGVPIILALFGLGAACLGGSRLYLNRLYRETGKQATATVTYFTNRRAPNSIASYGEYQFKTEDGREVHGNQSGYYLAVGETVTIEYLPESAEWNRIYGAGRIRAGWNIPMVIVGSIFFVLGVAAVVKEGRKSKES